MAETSIWNDPEFWALMVGAGSAAFGGGKGDLRFSPIPETPEQKALRIHAQRMAGVPGPDGKVQPGALPTMSYLGPQVERMLAGYDTERSAYNPLNYLDVSTGKEVARPQTPVRSVQDYNTLIRPWVAPGAPGAGPGRVSGGGGGNGAMGGTSQDAKPFNRDMAPADGISGLLNPRMPVSWGGKNVATPGNYPGVTNPNVSNPYLTPSTPGGGGGMPAPVGYNTNFGDVFERVEPPEGVAPSVWNSIKSAWNNFRASTPGWADMGIGAVVAGIVAATGNPQLAPIVYRVISGALGGGTKPTGGNP